MPGIRIELIETSRRIMGAAPHRPSQADLRRAISTAYYAMFHVLASYCADEIVGASPVKRASREWIRVYRALEHGRSRKALEEIRSAARYASGSGTHSGRRNADQNTPDRSAETTALDPSVLGFCEMLERMKRRRHEADYDPRPLRLRRGDVSNLIDESETAAAEFLAKASPTQRRALAFACIVPKRN